jgi:MarR family transcriptional regulator, 2-MHQ and catechol-resistance regulon repressor
LPHFAILEDGKLNDLTIQKTIEQLRETMPLNESAVEAHLALFRAYAVCFASLASRYEDLGLSVPRLDTLRWLYLAVENKLTITELSAHLEASLASVMRMVQALETEGWVRRYQSSVDRRVTVVELTDAGRQKCAEVLPQAMAIWSEMWSGLNDGEKATLSHLLAKFRINLLSRYIGHESLLPYKIEDQKRRHGASPHTPG